MTAAPMLTIHWQAVAAIAALGALLVAVVGVVVGWGLRRFGEGKHVGQERALLQATADALQRHLSWAEDKNEDLQSLRNLLTETATLTRSNAQQIQRLAEVTDDTNSWIRGLASRMGVVKGGVA